MRALTPLEAQFLERLRRTIGEGTSRYKRVFLTRNSTQSPALQIGLEAGEPNSLIYYNVLIYGTRPVRYHLETEVAPEHQRCRGFWNKFFGALNLVEERSGLKNQRMHLFYEVAEDSSGSPHTTKVSRPISRTRFSTCLNRSSISSASECC